MHDHLKHRGWLTGWVFLLLAVASGCFQPAGGGLEATNASEALPTFTMIPSDTPTPIPPTETPVPEVIEEPTATLLVFDVGTPIAQVPEGELDPIWQTATAIFLEGQGVSPVEVVPLEQATQPVEVIDPLLQTATALVANATLQAAIPITQTYEAMFGATPTAQVATQQATSGPVLSGQDCVYEVQPTDRNLYQISLLFGLPYMDIARASNLVNPNLIHVGDRLIIPGCGTTGYQPPPTSTPGPGATVPPGGGSGGTYVVVAGDTLFALSLAWGTTVQAIAALNGIPNVNLIYIGQTLQIP